MIVQDWMARTYHSPFDDLNQKMCFETGVKYAGISFLTGLRVAKRDARPPVEGGDLLRLETRPQQNTITERGPDELARRILD